MDKKKITTYETYTGLRTYKTHRINLSLNFILKPLIKAYKWFKGLFKSKVYLNYKPYIKKMAFIEMFYFQQRCRLESIKNM